VTKLLPPPAPARAAYRRPWRETELASLDFEATGLTRQDTIISFGVVPIRRGGIDVGRSVYRLVDPGDVVPTPASVTVHGLRPMDLVDAPSLEAAKETLRTTIGERFLVTWWAPVESAFLDKMFGGGVHAWRRRGVDVRDLLLALEGPQSAGLTLVQAAERFGVPVASPHHALDDALVTAQLFLVVASKLGRRAATMRDMQRLRPGTRRGRARALPRRPATRG
jgi:DNA polymerase-3 subunit epsilon